MRLFRFGSLNLLMREELDSLKKTMATMGLMVTMAAGSPSNGLELPATLLWTLQQWTSPRPAPGRRTSVVSGWPGRTWGTYPVSAKG
jgi:hypothetical protein